MWLHLVPVSWEWEVVDSFFRLQQLEPFWIDIRTLSNAGKLDAETGRWDGFIGMVGGDHKPLLSPTVSPILTVQVGYGEADLGLRGSGHCDQERSKVVLCSPGISYHINYWSVPAAAALSSIISIRYEWSGGPRSGGSTSPPSTSSASSRPWCGCAAWPPCSPWPRCW